MVTTVPLTKSHIRLDTICVWTVGRAALGVVFPTMVLLLLKCSRTSRLLPVPADLDDQPQAGAYEDCSNGIYRSQAETEGCTKDLYGFQAGTESHNDHVHPSKM